jgi:hypothetical protein
MLPAKYERQDHIDRIIAVILGDAEPTEQITQQLEKIDLAWSMLQSGYSRLMVVRMLQKKISVQSSQAYKIVRDAMLVYGDVSAATQKGIKAVHAENFKRLARKAESLGDLAVAGALFAKAAKVEGAFEADVTVMANPEEWMAPPLIQFTTDPAVFIASQRTEDVSYEEVKDADLPK